jgi:hypothetical protein
MRNKFAFIAEGRIQDTTIQCQSYIQ